VQENAMKVQLKSGFMGLLLSHIGAPTIHTSSTVKAILKPCLRFAILLCAFSLQHAWAQTGTITIVKVAQPHDARDFNFYAFGPHSSCCMPFQLDDDAGAVGANNILSNTKTWTLAPGSYSFKEDFNNPFPVTGWNLMSISCLPASSATVDLPNHAFTANLTAGHHITCTFTNKKVPSTPVADLSVTKTCAVNGPQSVLCTVTVTNLGPLPSVSPISISDIVTGAPSNGIYTGAGGTLPISCSPGAGPILPIACTANTSLAPSQSKNALFSFKLPSGGSFMNCVTVTEGASPGTPSDPNPANNTHICASVTVPSLTGTVTVKKILVPATDPGKFTLQLKNGSGTLLANFLNGGNGAVMGPVTVPTGNYNVSEVGGSNGTSLANYTSAISGAGCAANGAVTVAAGDHKFCTITNTRNGSSWPLSATVTIYNPMTPFGPQSVDIAVGGTVTFHNSNSGANWTILRLTGPTTFGPVPLPNNTTHATGIFTTAGTYTYQINGTPSIVVHGTIIVH